MTQMKAQDKIPGAVPGEALSILISPAEIDERLTSLANEINRDFVGKTITLVGALKGAVVFLTDLARKLDGAVEFDFVKASSYGDADVSSGKVQLETAPSLKLAGKHVLLVEDIVDSGRTLVYLKEFLQSCGADSVKTCALLDKPERREVAANADYVGFTIPNEFVVGYGLDYAQRYRNLPFVGILKFI